MLEILFGPRYQFEVGDGVFLPARNSFFQVQWRGYLRVGPPGQRRVPIYWLGELHWDCYYEDELVCIESLPFYACEEAWVFFTGLSLRTGGGCRARTGFTKGAGLLAGATRVSSPHICTKSNKKAPANRLGFF